MEFLLRVDHSVINVRRCRDTSSTRCSEKCGSFLKKDSVFPLLSFHEVCFSILRIHLTFGPLNPLYRRFNQSSLPFDIKSSIDCII